MDSTGLVVTCHAGYRGDETPRQLRQGDQIIDIVEVIERRRSPTHDDFRVRDRRGDVYILRHVLEGDRWERIFV